MNLNVTHESLGAPKPHSNHSNELLALSLLDSITMVQNKAMRSKQFDVYTMSQLNELLTPVQSSKLKLKQSFA